MPALVAVALVAAAPPAPGQISSQVVPVKMTLEAVPGQVLEREASLSNLGREPVVVRVRLSDWRMDESGDMEFLPAGQLAASLSGLVTFEPHEFSLDPGESGPIRIRLTMPADGPATRWGLLLSEIRPVVARPTSLGPRAIVELGTTLYLTRAHESPGAAALTALEVRTVGRDSLALTVRVANGGARHLYVRGALSLVDAAGTVVRGKDLAYGVLLPGSGRRFDWTPGVLSPGRYLARVTLDTGEPELLVGEKWFEWPQTDVPPPLAESAGR